MVHPEKQTHAPRVLVLCSLLALLYLLYCHLARMHIHLF